MSRLTKEEFNFSVSNDGDRVYEGYIVACVMDDGRTIGIIAPTVEEHCGSTNLSERGFKLWFCNSCKCLTDCEDDGDIGYKSPERNASSKEEYLKRKRERDIRFRRKAR